MSETVMPALPEFAGFFENARTGRLCFPRCRGCRRFHWYPMPQCPHCRGGDIVWQPVAGRGELISFTRVTYPFDKSRADGLPYIVALVKFADAPGVNLVTNILGADAGMLEIGQAVEPVFQTDDRGLPMVLFRTA